MWKYLFQEHILGRGIDYFIRNLVEELYIKDNIIEATVVGTEEYKVEIVRENEEIIDLSCTCPYANDGNNCKHMAAVLFYLEKRENTLLRQDKEKEIVNLLEEIDTTIMKEFLIDILKNDEKLLNRFKIKIKCATSPRDIKRYKNQINNIFSRYGGQDDFIDYKNAWGFISRLVEILDNDIRAMVDNNQFQGAFELTNYIFIKIANQDMDDSDGGTSEIARICSDIWEEILYNCHIKFKREVFKWFMDHLDGSVIDYMEEYLEDFVFDHFKEEEFLERKIKYLDSKLKAYKEEEDESWISNYKLGELALRRIKVLELKNVNQEEVEKYCKENLEINEVRKYYIHNCIKRKDYDRAIELLKDGKVKGKDLAGILLNYSLELKDLYKQLGKESLYEEELWKLVLDYKPADIEIYKELKSIYTDKEWLEKREIIFSKLSSNRDLDKLYELEGLYDRLIHLVMNSQGLYMVMEYEEILRDIYPKELLNKYENAVKVMATKSLGRSYYRDIVSILKRMKKYPSGKEKVSGIVNLWKGKYRNRPAMMDELNKL